MRDSNLTEDGSQCIYSPTTFVVGVVAFVVVAVAGASGTNPARNFCLWAGECGNIPQFRSSLFLAAISSNILNAHQVTSRYRV